MSILDKIEKKLDELGAYYMDYHCGGPHAEACARGDKKKKKKVTENGAAHSKFGKKVNFGKSPYEEEDFKAQLGWENPPRELGPTIRFKKKPKKKSVTEQIDYMVAEPHWAIVSDEKIFTEMANFIMTLEPDQLDAMQLQKMVDIFSEIKAEAEMDEEVKAKKSDINVKQYAGKYYRTKKDKIKKKKVELERSLKGKARSNMKPIMAKGRKTPTGRHKTEYNV